MLNVTAVVTFVVFVLSVYPHTCIKTTAKYQQPKACRSSCCGSSGIPGIPGIPGRNGKNGKQGPVGSPGTPGVTGAPGKKGEQGKKGKRGDSVVTNWKQCTWKKGDGKDNGIIKSCPFVKKRDETYLRVFYGGTLRIYNCNGCCKRWYFTFGGRECIPAIDGVIYMAKGIGRDIHRHRHIEGYCGNITRGNVNVQFHVGNCHGYGNADAYSGWNSVSRIVIQEVQPPQA